MYQNIHKPCNEEAFWGIFDQSFICHKCNNFINDDEILYKACIIPNDDIEVISNRLGLVKGAN